MTKAYDASLRRTNLSLLSASSQPLTATAYAYADAYSNPAARLRLVADGLHSATYEYLANAPQVSQVTFATNDTTVMTTTKEYDALNRLTNITSAVQVWDEGWGWQDTPVTSFAYAYNAANQRTSVTHADGSRWVYSYDSLGQVTSGRRYWADGTPVPGQQFEYAFDKIGNRQSTRSGGDSRGANLRPATYNVNSLNQYTSRTVPGYVNVLGTATNLATVTVWSGAERWARAERQGEYWRAELGLDNGGGPVWLPLTNVAVLNRGANPDIVATVTGNVFVAKSPENFGYDADGNMTNDGRWVLTWDAENRLVRVMSYGASDRAGWRRVDWAYDALGRRIRQTSYVMRNGVWVVTEDLKLVSDPVWFGRHIVELDATNHALVRSYVWGLDLSETLDGAGGVGGLLWVRLAGGPASGTQFVTYDGNGNVWQLVSGSTGTETARYEYAPFGEPLRTTGPAAPSNPFRFSTKRKDSATGLVLYEYRAYSAGSGRWLTIDPLEEVSTLTFYGIVRNDPLSDIDALGKLSRQECLQKLRGLKTHLEQVKDHFSANHCNAIAAVLELFENSPCKKWAHSLDSELQYVIDVFNRYCKQGMRERQLPIPKICERCATPTRDNVVKWIAIGALCAAGGAIIVFDIVTMPSGEGACGVVLIRYACTL